MTPEATPAAPTIPDYELLRLVGRGSYGDVWLARGVTGLYRAVKIVWRDRFENRQPYEREFKGLREFATVSLTEARQLALLHVGRNDAAGFFYYIMELADDAESRGEINPATYVPHTLKVVRERRGRVPAPQVIALGTELARALAGLHARGLVHRDVKPSNVIFVGGVPKLADIGLVAVATSAHTFVGTEGFVPPEGPGTPTADVFSFGKLLYEISTGLDRHEYPRLPPNLGELPDRKQLLELNEIIIRACDPAPAKRYVDANALLEDLLLLQAGRSMRRLRATERSLNRAVRVGTALGLIAVIAGTGVYLERQRAEQENALRRNAEAERDDLARKTVYSAGLARAQRAIDLGNFGQARSQLGELVPRGGAPDLRGFEWHMLKAEAQGDPAEVLQETGSAVEKIRFSPDNHLLAWQSADMRVLLWDVPAHKPVRTIESMYKLAGFSADGRWLVGVDTHAAFQRWSVDTGLPDTQPASRLNRPLAAFTNGECGVCFTDSEDGIAPHALRIWDFGRHAEVMSLPIPANADGAHWDFYLADVSADNRLCAIVLITGRAYEAKYQLQTWGLADRGKSWAEPYLHSPSCLAFSPDGTRLAIVARDVSEVQMRNLSTGVWLWRQSYGPSPPETLSFSPDGALLAVAGRDSMVNVVESSTGERLSTLHGQSGTVTDLAWSSDGQMLASASNSGNVRLWREPLRPTQKLMKGEWNSEKNSLYGAVRTSRDGRHLAVSLDGTQVKVLATDTLTVESKLPDAMRPVTFLNAGRELLVLTPRGRLKAWRLDLTDPTFEEFIPFKDGAARRVELSANAHWLATADFSGRIQVWDWLTKQLIFEQQAHKILAMVLAFSPDGESLISVGDDKKVKVWETRTGRLRATLRTESATVTVTCSPRGDLFAVSLNQGSVNLYDLKSPALKHILQSNNTSVTALAFSPDGSRLVCGGPGGLLQVYATDDWREVTTLMADSRNTSGNNEIDNIVFSDDGRIMAAYLNDSRLRVWRQ